MKKKSIKIRPILVMQITKSRFFLAARGVQLANGVTPPWKYFKKRHNSLIAKKNQGIINF